VLNPAAEERERRIGSLPMETTARASRFLSGTFISISEIWGRRELLLLLVRRELKARYKDSSLGIVWSLIRPLAQLLIYYFAIGQILGAARSVPSFAIFVFIGLTGWTLFTEIVTNGTRSIVDNAGLVKKVYLPREIFPLAAVGGAMFNLAIQLVILIAATIVFGQFPLSLQLLWVFPSLLLLIMFGTAIALLLSALNVYFRDFQHLVEVVLIVFFWASPIVYSYHFVHAVSQSMPVLGELYLANPVTLGVLGLQRALWTAGAADPTNWPADLGPRMLIAFAASLVVLWISQRVFSQLQGNFAQEL
jgi:ABC-2 type transport system permease protein